MPRFLAMHWLVLRFFTMHVFVPRFCRRAGRCFAVLVLALRLQLVDASLRFDHRRITDLLVLARTIAAVAVASATIAAAAPVLFAIAVLARLLSGLLALGELMELRRFALHRRLRHRLRC